VNITKKHMSQNEINLIYSYKNGDDFMINLFSTICRIFSRKMSWIFFLFVF